MLNIATRLFLAWALFLAFSFSTQAAENANAFQGPGCMGKCTDCHSLSKDEAVKILKTEKFKAQVKDVRMSPVKGLWEVEITQGDKVFVAYVDFAKKFLVEGKFTPIEKIGEPPSLKKIDLRKIPLENAIVYGDPKAEKRIIVFDDPDCPYCKQLHEEIKKIIKTRKDIAFFIKMYPLPIHPGAYEKSKTVVCKKSPKLLDDAFEGKTLPKADCKTDEIDNNIKLAEELGIRGTPALILPDSRLLPGYVPSDVLLKIMETPE